MEDAVIVAGVRTAVGKAPRGALREVRPDELGALVIKSVLERVPQVKPEEVDDVIVGCAFPEGEQGMNLGRIVSVRAGLPYSVPGMTVNRFCSSGLQSIAIAAEKVMLGFAEVVVAGGTESMSRVPMGGHKVSPNPELVTGRPENYMSMGHTAEEVARRFGIAREEQDRFALTSHQKAAAAINEGRFREEIVPVRFRRKVFDGRKVVDQEVLFDTDEGVRFDTSLEGLSRLKPAFTMDGSVTAGNSSQTSDGAAAVLVMSGRKAAALGLRPMAIFRSFAVGGVPPEVMGIGPTVAVPKALKLAGITQDQVGLIELNEAFASQSLYVIRHLGLNQETVNVNGGAIALGHPLGCTGTKLTVTLLHEAARRKVKYGLVTMCIGGGMGAAGVFEFLP
ncbi:MAG: acetyl-CoA C-acyltransferase [Firmicutes bacterium]|nr:acetyl-CoA C-acyltransferase [Bacillota bacterium]MCL5039680.1 acetyl-CoA C-acyltransferase [Bacillota bacterium]